LILDTNALSAWADGDPAVAPPLLAAEMLVVGEFEFGIRQSRHRSRYEAWLRRSLALAQIAVVNSRTARHYAEIRIERKTGGCPLPANDLWIAAIARQHDLPVLSRDGHFDRVAEITRIPF